MPCFSPVLLQRAGSTNAALAGQRPRGLFKMRMGGTCFHRLHERIFQPQDGPALRCSECVCTAAVSRLSASVLGSPPTLPQRHWSAGCCRQGFPFPVHSGPRLDAGASLSASGAAGAAMMGFLFFFFEMFTFSASAQRGREFSDVSDESSFDSCDCSSGSSSNILLGVRE